MRHPWQKPGELTPHPHPILSLPGTSLLPVIHTHSGSPLPGIYHRRGWGEMGGLGGGLGHRCFLGRDLSPTADSKNNLFLVCSGRGPQRPAIACGASFGRWAARAVRQHSLLGLDLLSCTLFPLFQLKPSGERQKASSLPHDRCLQMQ